MGAEYPATCGVCGITLAGDDETALHVGPCFVTHRLPLATPGSTGEVPS